MLFTCNPVSGDPSMVAVNASWGLGLAVVGGEVTPDDYLVSKVTREVVREHVHAKDVEYVPDAGGRGAVRVDVPEERREVPCLDRGGARRARRPRPADRALLRLPPGRRVGDRAGAGAAREPVHRPVAAGDRAAAARASRRPRLGDGARDEHVRRSRGEEVAGGARATTTSARSCGSSTSPSSTSSGSRPTGCRSTSCAAAPLPPAEPERRGCASRVDAGAARERGGLTIESPMIGTFYRAPAPGERAVRRGRDARRARHDRLHHRGDEDDELGPRRASRARSPRSASRTRSRSSTGSRSSGWKP